MIRPHGGGLPPDPAPACPHWASQRDEAGRGLAGPVIQFSMTVRLACGGRSLPLLAEPQVITMTDKRKRKIRRAMAKSGMSYQAVVNAQRRTPGPFERLVSRIAVLATNRRDEDAAARRFYVRNIGDLHAGPAERPLIDALDATSDADARKLELLMYLGRDCLCGEPVRDLEDFGLLCRLTNRDDHSATVDQIGGKLPLDEYLEAGLRAAKRLGVELEAPTWDETAAPRETGR
jgi:hypothetical protein